MGNRCIEYLQGLWAGLRSATPTQEPSQALQKWPAAERPAYSPATWPDEECSPRLGDKLLPPLPVLGVSPPLPLAQRRPLRVAPPAERTWHRIKSWSEDQIDFLQEENKRLRYQISRQNRAESESREAVALLQRQNACYLNEIRRQSEKVAELVESVAAVFQEFKDQEWGASKKQQTDVGPTIDEIIHIYSDL